MRHLGSDGGSTSDNNLGEDQLRSLVMEVVAAGSSEGVVAARAGGARWSSPRVAAPTCGRAPPASELVRALRAQPAWLIPRRERTGEAVCRS